MIGITRLPKWAQEHITQLQRQRDNAVEMLERFQAEQQEGPFVFWDLGCHTTPPEYVEKHFQGHRMRIEHGGMRVEILLRDDTIEMQYEDERRMMADVILQPYSYQSLRLKMPKDDEK